MFNRLCLFASFLFLIAVPARAAEVPVSVLQAVVWVNCEKLQGTGTVVNGVDGYVVTNAHVVRDVLSGRVSPDCTVGFVDPATELVAYQYHASVERVIFNQARSQDFAMLKIGAPMGTQEIPKPFPFIKTNEFPAVGDAVTVIGFSGLTLSPVVRTGNIEKFENGFIQVSTPLYGGDSGGAALDKDFHLIGMPAEVLTFYSYGQNGTETSSSSTYQVVDIRAVMNWLDTYGVNEHDKYFTHADYARYHKSAVYIKDASLGCEYLGRTELESTVYCLSQGGDRYPFPTEETFYSWYPGFTGIGLFTVPSVQSYTLTRNVTFKPGTLVKSKTSPQVYVVVDTFGAMRWVPSEAKAKELWGSNWASLVRDIPDEFFANYTVGQPLDP